MPVEVLYNPNLLPQYDLYGILTAETKICGVINNLPFRRKPMPFHSIDLYAGDNRRFRCFVRSGDLNVINIDGAVCVLTVKGKKEDTVPVIQKSTNVPGEGQIGSADEGECFFYILPSDTTSLDIQQYVFDVRVTLASLNSYTIMEGVLNLLKPVN